MGFCILRGRGRAGPPVPSIAASPIRSRFEGVGSRPSAERRVSPDLRGSPWTGRQRQPHEAEAYELRRRVGDAVAVLDVSASSTPTSSVRELGSASRSVSMRRSACSRSSSAATSRTRGPRVADRPGGRRGHRRLQAGRDGLRGGLRDRARLPLPGTGPEVDAREERPRRARGRLALGPPEGPVSQHLGTAGTVPDLRRRSR